MVDHTVDRLSEDISHRDDVDLVRLLAQGDRIGEDDLLECRGIDTLRSRIAEHSMAGSSTYATSSISHHQVSSLTDRTGRIDDIVHEDDVLTLHIPDDGHLGDFVGLGTALMTDDHGHTEELRIRVSSLSPTDVRRSDHRAREVGSLA